MSYATPADVANIMGGAVDDTRTQALLDMGTELIDGYLGVDAEIDPAPVECRMVNANMVVRTLSNPQGVKSEQLASYSTTYATTEAGLYLSPDDKAMLDGIPGATMLNASVYDVATPPFDPAVLVDGSWYEPGMWHVPAATRRRSLAGRVAQLPPGRVARR
jgi:hypothetical protein